MTDYEWPTEMGIYHRCRKEKPAPGRKFCFGCLGRICVRCSKEATHGMYCYEHYIKGHRRSRERAENAKARRHDRGLVTIERKNNGLCLWCGETAMNGTNVCKRHSKIFLMQERKRQGMIRR